MSPLGAAVLGGLLGLLIGFVVSALLHGPSRPPNKGGGGSGWNGHPVPPVPAEGGSWVGEVELWLHRRLEALT